MSLWYIGYGYAGGSSNSTIGFSNGTLYCSKYTLSQDSRALTVAIYCRHSTSGHTGAIRLCLFKDDSGSLGDLYAVTDEITVVYGASSTWYIENIESADNTNIPAGDYWLCAWGGPNSGLGLVNQTSLSGSGPGWYYKSLTYSSTADPTGGSISLGSSNVQPWIYAKLCEPNTFGQNDVLSFYAASVYRRGMQYPLLEDATVSSIWMYCYINSGSCYVKAGIYEDVSDYPEDRLGVTEEITVSNTSPEWKELTFPTPVSLSAGTYWIGWENSASFNMYRVTAGSDARYANQTTTYSSENSPITPFNPASAFDGYDYSIYAEYVTSVECTVILEGAMSATNAMLPKCISLETYDGGVCTKTVYLTDDSNWGYIYSQDASYANARSGSGSVGATSTSFITGQSRTASTYVVYQGFFDFDTSFLTADATINSATLTGYYSEVTNDGDFSFNLDEYDYGTFSSADFIAGGDLSARSPIATKNTSTETSGASMTWPSSANMISAINKTGNSRFITWSQKQEDDTAPTTVGYSNWAYYVYSIASGFFIPYLTIEYYTFWDTDIALEDAMHANPATMIAPSVEALIGIPTITVQQHESHIDISLDYP